MILFSLGRRIQRANVRQGGGRVLHPGPCRGGGYGGGGGGGMLQAEEEQGQGQ